MNARGTLGHYGHLHSDCCSQIALACLNAVTKGGRWWWYRWWWCRWCGRRRRWWYNCHIIYMIIIITIHNGAGGIGGGGGGGGGSACHVSVPRRDTVSFHNFKSQKFRLSVSNPKSKYVAYLSVLSQISNRQGLGRKNKHEMLKPDRMRAIERLGESRETRAL